MKTQIQRNDPYAPKKMRRYEAEFRSLIWRLNKQRWPIVQVDNGEESTNTSDADKIIQEGLACDECHVYFTHPNGMRREGMPGKTLWAYLVLGNSPGELVCDYASPNAASTELDGFFKDFYEAWEQD